MRVYTVKKRHVLTRTFWLAMTFLGLASVARALWALAQPWGILAQKLLALPLLLIWTMYFFYQFVRDRIPGHSVLHSEKFEGMSFGILSFTFCVAACGLFATGAFETRLEQVGACIVITFFSFGTVYLFREALRK